MELSDSAVEGVQAAGSTSFDEGAFQSLLRCSLQCILEPETWILPGIWTSSNHTLIQGGVLFAQSLVY